MGKRREATRGGIEHGVVAHPTHQEDKLAFEKRRKAHKKTAFVAVKIAEPGMDYEPFDSDVSMLGQGANWLVGRRSGAAFLSECEGNRWIGLMSKIRSWASFYHQRQVRNDAKKGGRRVGYYRRKIKDRVKLGPTDKHARHDTDLMRETIDLRPDHSRALQYMMETAGLRGSVLEALKAIRAEKIRLFEEIYGRRVVAVGEHPDSGQYHNDLWHTGIKTVVVDDYGGEVLDDEEVEGGEGRKVRTRTEFRQFGVSVGLVSWDRHRAALEELGIQPESLMREEMQVVTRNSATAEKQNGEPPRDLRLVAQLDSFVRDRLEAIERTIYRRASEEYGHWLQDGYQQGCLGLMGRSQRIEKLELEVTQLRLQSKVDTEHRNELNGMITTLQDEVRSLRSEAKLARAEKAKSEKNLASERSIKAQAERDLKIRTSEVSRLVKQVEGFEKNPLLENLTEKLGDFIKMLCGNRVVYETVQHLDPLREFIDLLCRMIFNQNLDEMLGRLDGLNTRIQELDPTAVSGKVSEKNNNVVGNSPLQDSDFPMKPDSSASPDPKR